MSAIGGVIAAPFKALGLIPKTPKIPDAMQPQPTPTRDDAAAAIGAEDELRRRRGGAADIVTGIGGAEPSSSSGKATLG